MRDFQQFKNILKNRLKQPLPGHEPFYSMTGSKFIDREVRDFSKIRKSAVLIALYPDQNDIFIPLILRPPYDGTHGGQMAFPGGRMEEVDESYERTALREAEEEIGLKALDVQILGGLSELYIPPSNYWVKPIVGVLDTKPPFFPDAREVAAIHEIPLSEISNPDILTKKYIDVRGMKLKTTGFDIQGQWIWGATALMMWELLDVLQDVR